MTFLGSDYNLSEEYSEDKKNIITSFSAYIDDCNERKASSSYSFKIDNRGFTSRINMESENLVFFSVPYESGWKAYVNGKEVEIEKVNVGFMAVLAPEGDCEIRFVYTTPGLLIGCVISAIAVIIAAIYIIICYISRTFRPQNWVVEYPEGIELND